MTLWGDACNKNIQKNDILQFSNLRINKGNYTKSINSIEETVIEKSENSNEYKRLDILIYLNHYPISTKCLLNVCTTLIAKKLNV